MIRASTSATQGEVSFQRSAGVSQSESLPLGDLFVQIAPRRSNRSKLSFHRRLAETSLVVDEFVAKTRPRSHREVAIHSRLKRVHDPP